MAQIHGDLHADKQHKGRAIIYGRFLSRLNIEYTSSDLLFHEKIGICQYDQDYPFYKMRTDGLKKYFLLMSG